MARKRYIGDYELLEEIPEKGRVRQKSRYIGKPWVFSAGSEKVKRARRGLPLLCAAAWVCYIGGMLLPSVGMHSLYVSLPYAFCGVPLFLLSTVCFSLPKIREPMEHRTADLLNHRFPPSALFLSLLALFAFAAEVMTLKVFIVPELGDAALFAGSAGMSVCAYACFELRRSIAAQEAPE